jgi:hypothetical protein
LLNLLAAVNSTYFFMGRLGVGVIGWLMLNSCAPSILIWGSGFFLRNPTVATAGALWMLRYGTVGLFLFSWQGFNLIPQVGHLLMTFGVLTVLLQHYLARSWRNAILGLGLGLITLLPFSVVQSHYCAAHSTLVAALFNGTLSPQ